MEAVLLLATIAQRFELDLEPGFPIVPQPSITLRPEYGIKVRLKQIADISTEVNTKVASTTAQ
jgi:hypothetical protein